MKTRMRTLFVPARLGLALLLATVALGALLVLVALAAPGDLDSSFDGDGKVTTDFGSSEGGHGVAIQSDGKIVVAGHAWGGSNYDFALARYEVSGTLDTSFGSNGKVANPIGPGGDYGYAVTIQPDGRIVVAGTAYNGSNNDFALARYEVSGTLDTSFGNSGVVTTPIGSSEDYGRAVAIQPDGKIVVAGYSGLTLALARYEISGTLDTSFDTDGIVIYSAGQWDAGYAVAIQPDGKIVVAGESYDASWNGDFVLARYEVSGTLDTSFGNSGVVTTPIGSSEDYGRAVAIQPDGKIVVAGQAQSGGIDDFALARYNAADGSLDNTFGNSGVVTTPIGSAADRGQAVAIQPDGKIVVAGLSSSGGGNWDFAVARYTITGTLDTGFGNSGVVTTPIGPGSDYGYGVAIQPDGKIVVAGNAHNGSNSDFAVVRYDTRVLGSATVNTFLSPIGDTNVSAKLESGECTVTATKTIAFPGMKAVLLPDERRGDPGEMPMYWEITTTCSSPYSMTLLFCYTDAELTNGISVTEENLEAFKFAGAGAWTNQGGTVDTGANCVLTYGVSSLSHWTLGDSTTSGNNNPTVVTLSNVGAGSPGTVALLALALAAALGAVGLAVARRRKTEAG